MIVADSGNWAATNAQQWYVGISRARKRVVVLAPDKTALRLNIQRSGERELAMRPRTHGNVAEQQEMYELRRRMRREHQVEVNRHREFMRQRMKHQQTRGVRI